MQVQLKAAAWEVGSRFGSGGFGSVFEAKSLDGEPAAAKFIPKEPGAKREMLFEDSLVGIRNVVPILDSGEDDNHWIIVMPRAEYSLRDLLQGGPLSLEESRKVLEDMADALEDLRRNGIVHRDLKPENVLWLEGSWCLADFGISRYSDAATAASTRKHSLSPDYAAPEQWRMQRATSATDIYALGVMAFELLNGTRPFMGSHSELREAHLHSPVPPSTAPRKLGWLIEECLEKSPESRPSPMDFRRRLELSLKGSGAAGLLALENANQMHAQKRAEAARLESTARTEAERRQALAAAARNVYERFSAEVLDTLLDSAPGANVHKGDVGEWTLLLGNAKLSLHRPAAQINPNWAAGSASTSFGVQNSHQRVQAPFDVISSATISLTTRHDLRGYQGRSHSLWYGDVRSKGQYGWYETAFIDSLFLPSQQPSVHPYALSPSEKAALALVSNSKVQHAWPFMPVDAIDLSEFINRWAEWLAAASEGKLKSPSTLPERRPNGSYRPS